MKLRLLGCGILLFVLFLSSCVNNKQSNLVLDASSLKAKKSDEVAEMLGKPDSAFYRTMLGQEYYIYLYHNHEIEIRFYKEKLIEVIIHNPDTLPFEPHTIEDFGLKYQEPTAYNPGANITWNNYDGFKAISFYLVGKKQEAGKTRYKVHFNYRENGKGSK